MKYGSILVCKEFIEREEFVMGREEEWLERLEVFGDSGNIVW